jgi:catalase
LPTISDADGRGNPRGISIKFHIEGDGHADLIAHSTPFFPSRTGEEFLEFVLAASASKAGTPSPTPLEKFLETHPSAAAFLNVPKPTPTSYATATYYSVSSFALINERGDKTFVRFRVVPDTGEEVLDEAAAAGKGPDFLQEEIGTRVDQGPVKFQLLAQIAEQGDVVDDATVHWPTERRLVKLGELKLDVVTPNNDDEQKNIIFHPSPQVEGIEASADPLFETRKALYLISGTNRRKAA